MKKTRFKLNKVLFVCTCLTMLFTGCGRREESSIEGMDGSGHEAVTLVLADFGNNYELRQQVENFNKSHASYQIEIRQYQRFEQEDGDGIERLQREIVSGKGPDIINFGYGYSVTDILGKYTEDLLPYFERQTEKWEEDHFANILKAFSYEKALYAMPVSFSLKTFAGRASLLGDRCSWSIEELMECYSLTSEKSGGSLMLYPGETKKDVFGTFILGSVANYVDWETGSCSFQSEEFQRLMKFANQFPDTLMITEDFSPMSCFAAGEALLYPMTLSSVYDISKAELVLGEAVSYVGYPVSGEDGTVIQGSDLMLAISSVSEHKDIAWEFLSHFLQEDYQSEIKDGFPVRRSSLEKQLKQGLTVEYAEKANGDKEPVVKDEIIFEGEEPLKIYKITQEEGAKLLKLIERASVGSAFDSRLHTILLEEVDSYFAGDKTLEEATAVMQDRTAMYVGEF